MGVRVARSKGNHGAFTDEQLAEKGLVAVETPGDDPGLNAAGLKHYSIRPADNPNPKVKLTEAEMNFVKDGLEKIQPIESKPKEFNCG